MEKDKGEQLGDPKPEPKVFDPAQDEKPEPEQSHIPVNQDGMDIRFKEIVHFKKMNARGHRIFNYTRRNSRTRPH